MNARIAVTITVISMLTGCVTSSPDVLLSSSSEQPLGAAQNSGQFPTIGQVPVGQTTQITPTQRKIVKKQLARDVREGRAQAATDQERVYKKRVAALKKLALENEKATRKKIERKSSNKQSGA